jgi:hypothetical protein
MVFSSGVVGLGMKKLSAVSFQQSAQNEAENRSQLFLAKS